MSRAGSPSPGEVSKRTLQATLIVIRDVLALKYGQVLDESDFISKAEVRCDLQAGLSPLRLIEALNSEPALKVKDATHERLLQLRFKHRAVGSFAELQQVIRQRSGTAIAVAELSADCPGLRSNPVAVFRETYLPNEESLTGRSPWDQAWPLRHFKAKDLHSALVIDPVVMKVLKFDGETSAMLELRIPEVTNEYSTQNPSGPSKGALADKLTACETLVGFASGSKSVGAKKACLYAKDLLALHPLDLQAQRRGCEVIGHFAAVAGSEMQKDSTGVVQCVTAAMHRHKDDEGVQEQACRALAGIASNQAGQALIAASAGIDLTIGAMWRHVESPGVQTWACGALAGFVINNPSNQSAVASARGIEAIDSAMKQHPSDARLQAMACGALGNLGSQHHQNQTTITRSISLIVSAMKNHANVASVQQSCCGALWCLAANHRENQSAVADCGGIVATISAMQQHRGNSGVQVMVRGLLRSLAANHSENQVAIATAGGSAVLAAVLKKPSSSHCARPEEVDEGRCFLESSRSNNSGSTQMWLGPAGCAVSGGGPRTRSNIAWESKSTPMCKSSSRDLSMGASSFDALEASECDHMDIMDTSPNRNGKAANQRRSSSTPATPKAKGLHVFGGDILEAG